jgi:uncharacterized membrane protein
MKIINLLPLVDWLAMGCFFAMWIGYALFAKFWGRHERSLIATTNRYRALWMLQATARDPRMLDGLITQNLSHTPSFFSSTTIIIIGGLLALMGTTDKAAELVRDIPFVTQTPMFVFEFKILVLLGIFVYAFFRFSWSMRQYTFVALVIGAMIGYSAVIVLALHLWIRHAQRRSKVAAYRAMIQRARECEVVTLHKDGPRAA